MKESHFLSKNVFWENAVGYLRNGECKNFQTFAIVFSTPENLLVEHIWSSRNEGKPLYQLKHVLRKCCGVSQKWWMQELFKLCHCVQHPWKPTTRDFLSSRNEGKPLSKQKCVLRKCCRVSQKWWMLELSNLCHCFQHPWKLTSRDFLSSRNEGNPLSKQKCVLRKCCRVSQKQWLLELSNLCHCVQHPWKLTSRRFLSSRNQNWWMPELSSMCQERKLLSKLKHVYPEILPVEISGALGKKESHFLSKNVFWENTVGYLRNGEY